VRTDEGWLYMAGILDLYSRRIVGWASMPAATSAPPSPPSDSSPA
jgi:putative transposase